MFYYYDKFFLNLNGLSDDKVASLTKNENENIYKAS